MPKAKKDELLQLLKNVSDDLEHVIQSDYATTLEPYPIRNYESWRKAREVLQSYGLKPKSKKRRKKLTLTG